MATAKTKGPKSPKTKGPKSPSAKGPKSPSAKVLEGLSPAPAGCEWLIIEKFGADPVLIESSHPLAARG